jgi:hypothetical protein
MSKGARPPRPVADVPPAALADGEAVAKGWLLALMAGRPLHDAAALPTAELAREGPALCAAILRAVGSDAAVDGLLGEEGPAARAGGLAGAAHAADTVAAVGLLRGALWEVLTAAMAPIDAATTAALAERLAWVCDAVAVASLAGGEVRVHDARGDWRAALERHVAAGRTVALLAAEPDDVPRLTAADPEGAAAALAATAAAVRAELAPADVLGREDGGRLWIVTAEPRARALAERIAGAVAAAAPVAVSVGVAVFPHDGAGAEALAARAEEALYAARAAGVPVA